MTAIESETADESSRAPATYRQIIAVTALASGMVATYLHLWKLGYMGALSCGGGRGCEVVQLSSWGWFLGVDVALIGAVGYAAILAVSLVGAHERFEHARWPTIALACLVYPAVLFTLRLKYAEFIVMKTFCPWCAISTATITLHAVLIALEWRRVRGQA
ncbi:MAG: vitamin K epoxide reductase family protein [Gemmatimonadaceae bacterium]